jgi:NADPH2:quinone reductase
MRAMQISELDGPSAMRLVDVPEPEAGEDLALIDVRSAGVSFVDLLMTQGQYQEKPELPFIPGIEVAGVVRRAPAGVHFSAGDRVAAYVPFGGYAEVVAAKPQTTFRIPDQLTFEQGAAIAMNFPTVHFALQRRGRVAPGEHVLVLGAAGGIGPVNVVVDPLGGDVFAAALRLLAPEGRHLVIGFAAGGIPEVRVNRLLLKNIEVVGVGWGAFLAVDPTIAASSAAELARMTSEGFVNPVIGRTYELADAAAALVALQDRTGTGKLAIKVSD